MDVPLTNLDWTLVQTFLAVAESGSLSEAARQLGLSQPTAGRHIARMEEALDVTLFLRRPRGLELTEAGAALHPHARAMAEAAGALSLAAAGRTERLAGPVRITASVFASHNLLPPIIARIRRDEPAITIDLVPSDRSENLLYREADIAVRMYRPTQLDVVTRHLGDLPLGVYAAPEYLDRRGRPRTSEELWSHDLIGYDRSDLMLKGMRDTGIPAERDWFATRCDDQNTYHQLLRAGCGVGFAMCAVADRDPSLERLVPDFPLPTLPVWLAAHESLRHTPRLRHVWDALAEGIAAQVP